MTPTRLQSPVFANSHVKISVLKKRGEISPCSTPQRDESNGRRQEFLGGVKNDVSKLLICRSRYSEFTNSACEGTKARCCASPDEGAE